MSVDKYYTQLNSAKSFASYCQYFIKCSRSMPMFVAHYVRVFY